MKFWERFYYLCEKNNKKPNAVCSQLGFSNATATHWKNGVVPKGDVLVIVADYFDVSIDYLLGRTNEPNGVYQNSNSGNIVNGNNGDNSPLTVNGKAAAPNKDTLTEQFMQKFEQLDFDDKVDVMQYVKNKK